MDVINSLLRAARAGNLKRVIEFIEDDLVDINSSNQNGLTALHSASKEGHVNIVHELIGHGANVHAKTLKGNTALHIASLAGHEPVVKILIDNGTDVDAQSASGFTALYMAAQENHEGIVRLLLASGANQNVATTDGFTPLAVAMQQGHEQIASILLNNEAKGRIRFPGTTESGRSLLHIAAKKDDCAAAALLMQNNISPDLTSKSGFTALHVACHYGNVAVAKLLIDRQADVNFQAKHNITPLHVAAKWGQESLVDLLVANSAKIDATTRDGLMPLHCAARSGHDGVVANLIRRGAPISAKTRSGLAPLHMATQGDHHKSAQILLNEGALVDDVTVDYLTALHVASHCGHVKVAKLLLNSKADPNFRALNGFTSLHIACKKNRIKIVELLLKYGASLNAVTESGLTPLHVASFMGCVNIVIYLLDNHASIESVTVRGETPLHLATRANQIEVINILLRYGANVSARAKESQTALHIASRLGNADIARLLIEQGVDVDAPTKDSYSALHIASKEGHEEVVNVLLNHGANISCATRNHGFTPLHLASKYGIDAVVDLLLSYGAPVNAQGKNGVTPLHVATHYDHPNVVQLLLVNRTAGGTSLAGASPHAMAKNGYTALHIAAKGNRLDIAQALLQHNANPNAESKAGFSPLHLAAQEGRRDMAALLLNNGASVNCKAKNGITPLHLCAQEDHVNVAQVLLKGGAFLNEQTRGGFTPLHVASHFARLKMIRFLLANGANVNIPAASGYTPLHQASQQGNPQIVELLLEYNAKPDALTESGQTALSIAQNLGYISIIDTLKVVTETIVKTTTMTITEEKFKIITPETMQETFVSDSEDEADDTAHAESVKFLTTDVMKNFNSMPEDYQTSQSNLIGADEANQQQAAGELARNQPSRSSSRQQVLDEMSQDLNYLSRDAPLDGGESTFGVYSQLGGAQGSGRERDESVMNMGSELADEEAGSRRLLESPVGYAHNEQMLSQLSPDNVDIRRPLQQQGPDENGELEPASAATLPTKPFLVSFMVDARGGAMRGCRHSGVRVIIPPHSAQMPMRITCRYLRQERLVHPPPLMEGEACASKIMEVGPAGAKFLGPVLIEVPHFASLRGREREIIILRSDRGEVWREHLLDTDDQLVQSIIQSVGPEAENQPPAGSTASTVEPDKRRLTRIVTYDFPQYFAIISRIRQEVHAVGPEGSTVNSQAVPRVQAVFTEGALTKRIKIGLQPTRAEAQSAQDGQPDSLATNNQSELEGTRPGSPESADLARPGSAMGKRRSKLLACFGTSKASNELINTTDESSAGGDSPKRNKRPKRNATGELDSEGEFRGSPSPDSLSGLDSLGQQPATVTANLAILELVPENYYIEKEPPLILNSKPKTYGKRLASSSAQTDQQGKSHGLSTSVRNKPKSRGFLRGKRRDKAQLTINCAPTGSELPARPKSASLAEVPLDSSLESEPAGSESPGERIRDVVTSDDHKWRTCTIQTDSDSLTVNYVSIAGEPSEQEPQGDRADDGYVSGSGDIKQPKGRGFFAGLSRTSKPEAQEAKKKKKKSQKGAGRGEADGVSTDSERARAERLSPELRGQPEEEEQQVASFSMASAQSDSGGQPEATPQRAAKAQKQKAKLERDEKLRRDKEEKRQKKELEDAEQKELKLKKKQEKEAKKLAKKMAKKSPSPLPAAQELPEVEPAGPIKSGAQVTFANVLVEEKSGPFEANNNEPLDSLQQDIAKSDASYELEKRRLAQEDGRDLVRVSISERTSDSRQSLSSAEQQPTEADETKLISLTDSIATDQDEERRGEEQTSASNLKPILKQQSQASESEPELPVTEQSKISYVADELVSEATQEAVMMADSLKGSAEQSPVAATGASKKELARAAKEEKERLKREAKLRTEEAKRAEKEAKKARELEAKSAKEERKRLKRQAKEAKKVEEKRKAGEACEQQAAADRSVSEPTFSSSASTSESQPRKDNELGAEPTGQVKSESSIVEFEDKSTEDAADSIPIGDKKKEKVAKQKRAKKSNGKPTDESDSTGDQSSKNQSFFGRLFKRRTSAKGATSQQAPANKTPDEKADERSPVESAPVVFSEMYPSNPDDVDGEMILEVNVAGSLIKEEEKHQTSAGQLESVLRETVQALKGDLPDQPVQVADSSANEPKLSAAKTASSLDQSQEVDPEATLVNISQVVSTEINDFDEDPTENVVSQANELNLESPSMTSPQKVPMSEQTDATLASGFKVSDVAGSVKEAPRVSSSELNLKEEKTKKELETKLQKEAKKRAKEDEKLRKKQEKEDKLKAEKEKKLAEAEAKKAAKEEKRRAKEEAKEAKKQAGLAKKQQKKDRKKQTESPKAAETIVVNESEVLEQQPASEPAGDEPTILDTSNMTPVKTETEVQRIVEEVVGEDGVLTKTTKTIETKYVTLRQEEIQVSERKDVAPEDVDKIETLQRSSSSSSFSSGSSIDSQGERKEKKPKKSKRSAGPTSSVVEEPREVVVVPCEHKELEELLTTASCFTDLNPPEGVSLKKEMKRRIKLNKSLIKRATGIAKSEAKVAKKKAQEAQAEIVVCDEAVKEALKELKKCTKESKHALKAAKKDHKKMDKIDKKLAKRQKKIEKKQEKLDKKAEKIAKKADKTREKMAKKEAKLERKSSQKSTASKKTIKLEDIGEPVLRSSSRLSIGGQGNQQLQQVEVEVVNSAQPQETETEHLENPEEVGQANKTVIERASPGSEDMQVEMSLEEGYPVEQQLAASGPAEDAPQESVEYTNTTETFTRLPDGRFLEEVEEIVLEGDEAREAVQKMNATASESDEEVDVVNELPNIKGKQQH